ncbi:MAG: CobW family GTP-binding protein [Gammaproteobacteria bacterium]
MRPNIPVTVLTGFLGSGKTTLLNRILSEDHGLRIAVIENEFGEIGIDQDLVINADEEVFEMNNGCICCNVRGDLIRILAELADRISQFDLVILETTGMADPAPVAQTFLVQEDIQDYYQLDGIITLVDAKHVVQHLDDDTDEVLAQVAFADRIIVNKVDLVSEDDKRALNKRLQSMNTMAQLYEATMADAPIPELLNIGGFNVQRAMDIKPNFLEPEYPFEWGGIWQLPAGDYLLRMAEDDHNDHDHDHDHDYDHDHDHDYHEHGSGMSILMANVDEDGETDLSTLAEKIFVEFSAEPETISHGQALTDTDRHYQLTLEGREDYEFGLSLDGAQSIALFTGEAPEGLSLKLVAEDGIERSPADTESFHGDHSHDSKVSSASIELPGAFDVSKLNSWLEEFLLENGPDIYRMKGVVAVEGQDYRFVCQGVHMIFGSQAGKPWGDETPFNRLVFIGKNLDEPYIRTSLEQCLA